MVNGMPLLPAEIKIQIVSNISRKKEILNLLASDSTFYHICQPILYRWYKIQPDNVGTARRAVQWCRSIVQNPRLALYVQELEVQSTRRRHAKWLAGGAMERLILKALNCLKNLQVLRLDLHSRSRLCLHINLARLQYPILEYFKGITTLSFLVIHKNIKKLHLSDLHPTGSWQEFSTITVLPQLAYYSGSTKHVRFLDPNVRLLGFSTSRHDEYDFHGEERLGRILRLHGPSLCDMHIKLACCTRQDIEMIAKCAPNLESLHIDLEPSLTQLGKTVLDDMLIGNLQFPSLRSFQLLVFRLFAGTPSEIVFPEPKQSEYVHRLHQTFPTLRFIHLSYPGDNPCGDTPNTGWRYNEAFQQWIPPRLHRDWRKATQEHLKSMEDRYSAALLNMPRIHAPFLEWHPLDKSWKVL